MRSGDLTSLKVTAVARSRVLGLRDPRRRAETRAGGIEVRRSTLRAMPTFVRTAGAVALAAALLAASPANAGDRPLVIRVYDMASDDARGRAAALRTAAESIASAGVTVAWRDCSRGGAAHPCRTVRKEGDLVVRVMPASGENATGQLGFAPLDPSGRATVIATVFYDMVLRVARRTGLGADELLGRAIAHEVGHLLLRAPGHGGSGLMRPLWTDEELMHNRPGDWTFSDADRRQVQAMSRERDPSTDLAASVDIFDGDATGR
jgi:hypothetical protein